MPRDVRWKFSFTHEFAQNRRGQKPSYAFTCLHLMQSYMLWHSKGVWLKQSNVKWVPSNTKRTEKIEIIYYNWHKLIVLYFGRDCRSHHVKNQIALMLKHARTIEMIFFSILFRYLGLWQCILKWHIRHWSFIVSESNNSVVVVVFNWTATQFI